MTVRDVLAIYSDILEPLTKIVLMDGIFSEPVVFEYKDLKNYVKYLTKRVLGEPPLYGVRLSEFSYEQMRKTIFMTTEKLDD